MYRFLCEQMFPECNNCNFLATKSEKMQTAILLLTIIFFILKRIAHHSG